jgi:ribosomal protein S18 acetylase RimI-like enzyme
MIIRKLQYGDREQIRQFIMDTEVFTYAEISVAMELIDTFLNNPKQIDYDCYSAVEENEVRGYICLGPTPVTDGTYDLYWIVVKPSEHGSGVGKSLMKFAEDVVKQNQGRLLIAETSSQPKYQKTRDFYTRVGYTELARIKDYYKVSDDLVIYGKYF